MPGFFDQIFGSKPTVPDLAPIDAGQEQLKAVQGNLKVLPSATKLANQVNTANQTELTRMLTAVIPDLANITKTASSNISSQLQGQIPQDVQDAIQNMAAARGMGSGIGGSGFGRNLVARDLGLTSLRLTQQGLSAAESWTQFARQSLMPGQFDVTSMFFSPQQRAALDIEERNTQFQREWMQSQIKAMPDPVMRGIHDWFSTMFAAYLGGNYSSSYNAQGAYSSLGTPGGGGGNYMPQSNSPGNYQSMYGSGSGGSWWGGTSGAGQADYAAFLGGSGGSMGGGGAGGMGGSPGGGGFGVGMGMI